MATDCSIDPTERAALAERLQRVRAGLAAAALAAGRRPEEITLVGVSKFMPAALACAAVDLGLADLGENRVQELVDKIVQLEAAGLRPRWHMIGTLQRNKVRMIVGLTELIHSVDTIGLIDDIGRLSNNGGLVSNILLQVNTSGEESKHGFSPDELDLAAERAGRTAGIRLCGLMTMAPFFPDPEMARPVFCQTRQIFDRLSSRVADPADFRVLSMGMSLDYRQAVACGATHVRIGTAIFGPRL